MQKHLTTGIIATLEHIGRPNYTANNAQQPGYLTTWRGCLEEATPFANSAWTLSLSSDRAFATRWVLDDEEAMGTSLVQLGADGSINTPPTEGVLQWRNSVFLRAGVCCLERDKTCIPASRVQPRIIARDFSSLIEKRPRIMLDESKIKVLTRLPRAPLVLMKWADPIALWSSKAIRASIFLWFDLASY
ncbi:hypothetical protein Nepgr_024146 [Nepenthes gracilis]|uniref:Uncharacterized protein n=1 Tax=Nepenthes gracilis TaxID=150966 RepID=A0AAD3XYI4_NEPGR|nr:hypothetical protein Nepgr_024146 [Nepenthes gracilis]